MVFQVLGKFRFPLFGGFLLILILIRVLHVLPSITNKFSGGSEGADTEQEDEGLNIFCVATGHLYERLLKIMMLSVMKTTKTPVKFWILKNFLSPSLKEFIPEYAKKYGFQYEYVHYKWPR